LEAEVIESFDAHGIGRRDEAFSMLAPVRALLRRFPDVSHGMLSLSDQVIVSGTSFATIVIIGRATSPHELGLYYLIASILTVAAGIQDSIVGAPYAVYSKRVDSGELANYAGSVWIHHLALTGLGMAALVAAIVALTVFGTSAIVPGLWIMLCAGPFILLREWVRRFTYANLQIISAVALDVVASVLQLATLMLLWRWNLLSIFSIYAVMGAACALACIGWFALARPGVRFERRRFASDWARNWSFARWTLRSYVVGNTTPYIMPWILVLAFNTAAAGVFGACVTLINVANLFLMSVDRVLTPRAAQAFARGGREELQQVLRFAAAILLPTLGAFCLVVLAVGAHVAAFVYGVQYEGHGATLSLMAMAMFTNGVGMIVGNGLWAIDKPRFNFLADVATLFVTLASAVVLIVPFGVLGAAIAMLAGGLVGCIVRALTLRRALLAIHSTGAAIDVVSPAMTDREVVAEFVMPPNIAIAPSNEPDCSPLAVRAGSS
jgi:O-antigen/teichoic acid export membrane protein